MSKGAASQEHTVDPLLVSIISHKLSSITAEMSALLSRTSRSQILNECLDFSMGILDKDGRLLSQVSGIPVQIVGATFMAKAVTSTFASDEIFPGDVFVMNDPYTFHGGTHLHDWSFLRPIFSGGEQVFWAMCRGHQMDCGGSVPTSMDPVAFDIIAEGLRLPPIKLYEKDKPVKAVHDIIMKNVRFPDDLRVDLLAYTGSLKLCERRLTDMIGRYGWGKIKACFEYAINSTEKAMRSEIRKIPDGRYEDFVVADNDGVTENPFTIRCVITVKGDEMTVDFTGTDKQRGGFNHSPLANTYAAAFGAIFTAVDPNIMHNDGSFKPIKIIAPEGTVVNPVYPADVAMCTNFVACRIIDAVMKALGKAIPEQVSAGWALHFTAVIHGRQPKTGKLYVNINFSGNGGSGALSGLDGWPHIAPVNIAGALQKASMEMLELKYPWLNLEYALNPDSGGAGTYRGGLGVKYRWVNFGVDSKIMIMGDDQSRTLSFGQQKGGSGQKQIAYILRKDGQREDVRTKKFYPLYPSDEVVIESSGGGGVGLPCERDVERVRDDVVNEYVSIESAKQIYGVALDPLTLDIDSSATKLLRAQIKAG